MKINKIIFIGLCSIIILIVSVLIIFEVRIVELKWLYLTSIIATGGLIYFINTSKIK